MADILRLLAAINARENAAHNYGRPLTNTTPDMGGDGKWDCEDYAAAKKFAPDWPQGVAPTDYNVTLPDGRLHRVVTANVDGKEYVLDNYSGNALLTKDDWERGGWKFAPFTPAKLSMTGAATAPQGLVALGQAAIVAR